MGVEVYQEKFYKNNNKKRVNHFTLFFNIYDSNNFLV